MRKLRNQENFSGSKKHEAHPGNTVNPFVRLDCKEKSAFLFIYFYLLASFFCFFSSLTQLSHSFQAFSLGVEFNFIKIQMLVGI